MSAPQRIEKYERRVIDDLLDEVAPYLPAVAIEGAKGVGKTQTALQRVDQVINLDSPGFEELIEADPQIITSRDGTLLVDEWQKYPPVWDLVRRAVDNGAQPGTYFLTGSAFPPKGAPIHSGAGRIDVVRMRPFALQERNGAHSLLSLKALFDGIQPDFTATELPLTVRDYAEEICRSGFPGIMDLPARIRGLRLNSYIDRLATHEFVQLGQVVRDPAAVTAWLSAYAMATARTDSYQQILDRATPAYSQKPSRTTTDGYRSLLEQLMILEELPAWRPLIAGMLALVTSPKHHLCDPGLAAALLGVDPESLLSGDPAQAEIFAQLFESFVVLSARVAAEALGAKVSHLRTRKGEREVDIIVEDMRKRIIGLEVKVSPVVRDDDVKHLHWLAEKVGSKWAGGIVVHAGKQAYRRADGIWVVPLAGLS